MTQFNLGSKCLIFLIVSIAQLYIVEPWQTLALAGCLLVLMFVEGGLKRVSVMFIWVAVIEVLYALLRYSLIPGIVVFPVLIIQLHDFLPNMVALMFVLQTAPGLISEGLARCHAPKRLILSMLVIIRFPATYGSFRSLQKEAMKKRKIGSLWFLITHPFDSFEYYLIPVCYALLKSADQLAASAVTRAAEAPGERTSYYARKTNVYDIAALASTAMVAIAVICIPRGVGL